MKKCPKCDKLSPSDNHCLSCGYLFPRKKVPTRTRNKDGRFRKKRSDTGKPRRRKERKKK